MTPTDLIADLRSRINPVYAHQLGTESYERRLCAEVLEQQITEIARLRQALKTASGWCVDMTTPLRMPSANEWGLRADNLLRWAGDGEA